MGENIKRLFEDDIREKKRIGYGSFHRKRGSRTKFVSLPSDYLTKGELKKMSSEVISLNLSQPIFKDRFLALNNSLKEEYIKAITQKLSITKKLLCELMGMSYYAFNNATKDCNISQYFSKQNHMTEEQIFAAKAFFGYTVDMPHIEKCEPVKEISPEPVKDLPIAKQRPVNKFSMKNITMNFEGEFNTEQFANSLRYVIGDGTNVRLSLSCEVI